MPDRLNQIRNRLDELRRKQNKLLEERDTILLNKDKEEYNCSCVRLNKDIDIYDSAKQYLAGRNGLGIGLVAETLSALNDCYFCSGKGKILK